ncbi:MAG: hypothetical protein ACYC09_00025 [Bacteroidota bacterium]
MKLIIVALIVLIINIPFGFWRMSIKKYSVQWFLAIHIPVFAIVFLRIYSGIGYALFTYVLLIDAFFGGQKLGGFLYVTKY